MNDERALQLIYENMSGVDVEGILAGKYGHEDSRFISDLDDKYVEGVPADQQSACIDYFFDSYRPGAFWTQEHNWQSAGFGGIPDQGTDEESRAQMLYVLKTYAMPEYIREMIADWYREGF